MVRVLVTGGVRSGKSRHAEGLLAGREDVTYVAPGPVLDDADWAARVAAHRARRPAAWRTLETGDLAGALAGAGHGPGHGAGHGAVLVDCLGTWLTRLLDDAEAWEEPSEALHALVGARLDEAAAALAGAAGDVVLVTNEVGLGVVPAHRSGRVFRDLLGLANQRLAAECEAVHLVVAGRVLML